MCQIRNSPTLRLSVVYFVLFVFFRVINFSSLSFFLSLGLMMVSAVWEVKAWTCGSNWFRIYNRWGFEYSGRWVVYAARVYFSVVRVVY